ncbi:RICIN domain-containing protein [Streptomyces sp. NPDC091377]|uniref:RICIN domain-containing protein n=1 Tax=Streptomyces sp. NPDC091377 TaxID=3365995 RepID=UPI003818E7DA
MQSSNPDTYAAWHELNHLHWSRTFTYAHVLLGHKTRAEQIADRACARIAGDAEGRVPLARPLRLRLLELAGEMAGEREADPPADGTDPEPEDSDTLGDFTRPTGVAAIGERLLRGFVTRGFGALSLRRQTLLWYSVVEQEEDARVARLTGVPRDMVRSLVAKSLTACSEASLNMHYNRRSAADCSSFARLLNAASRGDESWADGTLARHLDACPWCHAAMVGLAGLRTNPRLLLSESLLGPVAHAYLVSLPAPARATDDTLHIALRPVRPTTWRWPAIPLGEWLTPLLRRPGLLVGLSTVIVLVSGTVHLIMTHTSATSVRTQALAPPPPAPQAPPPTPDRPSASPARTPPPKALPVAPPPPSSSAGTAEARQTSSRTANPSGRPPRSEPKTMKPFQGKDFVAAVHAESGLCLDVSDAGFSNGTDVVLQRCTDSAESQLWRFEPSGLVRNAEQPAFCLDARGRNETGVGIWNCRAIDTGNPSSLNVKFALDSTGRIQPARAPGSAVAPDIARPGSPLDLRPVDAGPRQRWVEPVQATDD